MLNILKCELCETSTDDTERMEQDAALVNADTGEAKTGTRCRDRTQCGATHNYLLQLGWQGKSRAPRT